MSRTDRTPAEQMRRTLLPLGILAFGHTLLGLCGLNIKWYPESVDLLVVLLPVSAALALWAGRWTSLSSPSDGKAMIRLSVPAFLAAVAGMVIIRGDGPIGMLSLGGVTLGTLLLVGAGYAFGRAAGRGALALALLYPLTAALGAGLVLLYTEAAAPRDRLLFMVANVPVGLFWLSAAALIRPRKGEHELVACTLPEGLELLTDALPLRVRHRVPCRVPYGLRVSSPGEGVTLHNPVLDHLLELSTPAPAAVASMFSENEDTVLALLHRFPDSRLEADAVAFEASSPQLADAGGSVQQALEEGVAAAEALALLLEEAGE